MPRVAPSEESIILSEGEACGENQELHGGDNDHDDDEDNIDWEEGDEEEQHAAAVEHTLALMETTGALRGGDVEIDLNTQATSTDMPSSSALEHIERAQKRLQKVTNSLATRHLPCLTAWVSAMIQADSLVVQGGALIAMSTDQCQKRQNLQQQLIELKSRVATTLKSASKLRIDVQQQQQSHQDTSREPNLVSHRHALNRIESLIYPHKSSLK